MKTTNKILSLACASALFASPVFADNTDTETVIVSGTVVASLELAVDTYLTMPNLVLPGPIETSTSVKLVCGPSDDENTVTYTQNGNPYAHGTASAANPDAASVNLIAALGNHTGECAVLSVTGESTYSFVVTLGNIVDPITGGITLANLACIDSTYNAINSGDTITFSSGGTETLRCGAQATATKDAVNYSDGSFDVTVTYD